MVWGREVVCVCVIGGGGGCDVREGVEGYGGGVGRKLEQLAG